MKNQLRAGTLLTYIQMALNIIVGLIYTPMMIRLLGQSEYGLYNTVSSTISMLSVLNLGFSSGYIRYFAKYKAKQDDESIYKLNGLFLIIFSIIGLIALCCGLFLFFNLKIVFRDGLTPNELSRARVLMLILTFNLTISFPMTVFTSIINANEKFVILKLLGMGKTVLSPILTIPLIFLGYGSVGVVTVSVLISLLVDITYLYYVLFCLKNKFFFRGFEKGIFRNLFKYTAFVAVNIITDQINWNIDKIILGRYCGTVAVAIYSVGSTVQTYYQMFSTAVSGVFAPRIHNIANSVTLSSEQKRSILTGLFIKVGRIQYIILALIMTGFVLFGKDFIRIWAGEGYDESYVVALLLMIPVTVPLIQNLGTEIQRAQDKHQLRSIIYAIMAGVNLVITIILCQRYGAVGAALGTTISLIITTGIIMNCLYYFILHINVVLFWKEILKMSQGLILPVAVGILLIKNVEFTTLISLVLGGAVYTIAYCISMWLFGMNAYERELLTDVIRGRR